MAVRETATETVSGTVASVNPKGVRLVGELEWRNYSRFADEITPPERGEAVTLTVDRQGFVRSVARDQAAANRPAASSSRDTAITRLAVLKAAAEWSAGRPEIKAADVLRLATCWERWVTRPADDGGADE